MSGWHGRVIYFFCLFFSSFRIERRGNGAGESQWAGATWILRVLRWQHRVVFDKYWMRSFFFPPVWEDFGGTAATFGGPERRVVSPNCKAPSGSVGSRSLLPYGDLSAVGSPSCKQMRRFLADVLASRSPVAVSLGRKQHPAPPLPARRCLMQVPNSAFSA